MYQKSYLRISEVMAGWDNRYRTRQSFVWAPRGLAVGLGAALALALVARLMPLFDVPTLLIISGAAALVGLLVALLGVWVWPRRPLAMARRFDALFGLRERMSTAVELAEGRLAAQSDALARAQLQDAYHATLDVNPADGLPLKPGWRALLVAGLLLVALLAALLLPNPQTAALEERRAVQQAVDEQLERLETVREEIANDPALSQEERAAIVETLDESIESLERSGVSREEAVAALSAAEQQLRDVSQEAQQRAEQQQRALESAGESFGSTPRTEALSQALQQGDYEAAAGELENLLDPNGEPLTPEEQEALQAELEQAADQVEGADPQLASQFRDAAEAVRQGNQSAAQQALSQASQQLSQSGQQAQQSQAAGQAAQQAAGQAQQGQQAVAQAGQQPGQGQAGQGQQPGQGQGQGQAGQGQAGQGQGQAGQGQPLQGSQGQGAGGQQPGTQSGGGAGTGAGTGEAQGSQISGQMPTNNDPQRDEERAYDSVFAPRHLGGEGGPVVGLPGQGDPSRDPVSEGEFVDNPSGQAEVPYDEVYADYADAANKALESEYVPLGMRDLVRQYFSSLDPDRQ